MKVICDHAGKYNLCDYNGDRCLHMDPHEPGPIPWMETRVCTLPTRCENEEMVRCVEVVE